MEDNTDSPLATRPRRNAFARKPLHELAKTPKPKKPVENEDENDKDFTPILPNSSEKRPSRRAGKPVNSPDFCTSSPTADEFSKLVSPPQVSMINKVTPKTNSAKKKTSRVASKLENTTTDESENEKEKTVGESDTPISTRTRSRIKDVSTNTIVQRSQRSINTTKTNVESGGSKFIYLLFVISALAIGYLATQGKFSAKI